MTSPGRISLGPVRRFSWAFLFFSAIALVCGCGKKGPPLPPVSSMPPAVVSLAARVNGEDVILTWNAAYGKEGRGTPPAGFLVYRGEALCEKCPVRFSLIARIPASRGGPWEFVDRPGYSSVFVYKVAATDGYGTSGKSATARAVLP